MNIKTRVLINKRTKQLSIALSRKKLKEKLKGRNPKFVRLKLEGFDF